jgi:Zn-dependent M28 family amino/carboxypeptidase
MLTQGINDDGSGTIALLDIALRLPLFKVNQAVRFGWWTAEEFGLVGSEYHIANLSEEERNKIALYLNFDMLASGNSGYFVMDGDGSTHGTVGPAGSDHIESLFHAWYAKKGLRTADAPFNGRSDYGPFIEVGIPSGGVLTGAEVIKTAEQAEWWGGEVGKAFDPCYHAKCDTIENLRTDVWVNNVKAAAHGIATYARSIDGIPRARPAGARTSGIRVSSMEYEERRHYTCNHDISAL